MKRDMIPLIKYIIKFSNPFWLDVYFSWRQQKLNLESAARSVDVSAAVHDLQTSTTQQNPRCRSRLRESKAAEFKRKNLLFHTVGPFT